MSDSTPMQACDYLYSIRSGLNSPDYWTTGAWEHTETTQRPNRDARGRFVPGGEIQVRTQRCLMGEFGHVCFNQGRAYEVGTPVPTDPAQLNTLRLLALGCDPKAEVKAEGDAKRVGEMYRKWGTEEHDVIRGMDRARVDRYQSIVIEFNDRHSYDKTGKGYGTPKETQHAKVLEAIDRALSICFDEAKAKPGKE